MPTGVRVIVVYKLVKAVLLVIAAIALWTGIRVGLTEWLTRLALDLTERAVHPLLARLCHWLSLAFAPGRVELLELVLVGDAILSAVEGWALKRGHLWGRWLVVLATGAFIPLEIFELVHKPRPIRALVLLGNTLILLYLAHRLRRHLDDERAVRAVRAVVTAAPADPRAAPLSEP
jgi:uncharacterized membrane protein (DUF2068 family)